MLSFKNKFLLDNFLHRLRCGQVAKHIPSNSVILDIGCGENGRFLHSIAASIKYGIGIDKDIQTEKKIKLEFRKVQIIAAIPVGSEQTDIITMIAVLEHLENPQEILNECFRILKNNGKLIFTFPAPLSKPILEFLAFKLRLIDKKQIEDHKNYFSALLMKKMLLKAGFDEKNIKIKCFEFGFNNLFIARK